MPELFQAHEIYNYTMRVSLFLSFSFSERLTDFPPEEGSLCREACVSNPYSSRAYIGSGRESCARIIRSANRRCHRRRLRVFVVVAAIIYIIAPSGCRSVGPRLTTDDLLAHKRVSIVVQRTAAAFPRRTYNSSLIFPSATIFNVVSHRT